jgi:hypothetical protein
MGITKKITHFKIFILIKNHGLGKTFSPEIDGSCRSQ